MKVLIILAALAAVCAGEISIVAPTEIKESPVGRIVYGTLATANQFPWQASVLAGFANGTMQVRCGGAIVSVNRVITAAHCIYDYQSFIVGVGSNNIGTPLLSQSVARVNVAVHPSFSPSTLNNDIAILILSYNLSLGASIAAIRLPRRVQAAHNYFAGQTGQIAGWGRVNDANTTLSDTLRYANIAVYTVEACRTIYGASIVTNATICGIGSPDTRANPCGGDSGGPLAWRDTADNITSIVGVFSFIAQAGCAAGYPSGYTNIGNFLDWISINTGIIIRA